MLCTNPCKLINWDYVTSSIGAYLCCVWDGHTVCDRLHWERKEIALSVVSKFVLDASGGPDESYTIGLK